MRSERWQGASRAGGQSALARALKYRDLGYGTESESAVMVSHPRCARMGHPRSLWQRQKENRRSLDCARDDNFGMNWCWPHGQTRLAAQKRL
jgi:hypothetical protein